MKGSRMYQLTNADVTFPELPPTIAALAGDSLPADPATAPALRWAIIGAGNIAHKFVRDARRANADFVAVGSSAVERARAFAEEMDIPHFGTYHDVLAREDVDAVYIATTHNFHVANALAALKAGKAVLVEKPIATSVVELQALRAAATEAGALVMEAMWSRFLPLYRIVRGIIDSGALGEISYVRAEHNKYLRGIDRMEKPELAGGASLDLGVYSASFIHWILGKPEHIIASGNVTDANVDLDVAAILRYPKAVAIYETSMGNRTATGATIGGTRGFIDLPDQFYRPSKIRLVLNEEGGRPEIDEQWSIEQIKDYGFEYQAAAFARAFHDGLTEVPEHTMQDAEEVLAILDEVRAQMDARAKKIDG